MHFQEKSISVNGLKTYSIEAGEGETIVFLHGWGARGSSYLKILTHLAQTHHVVALDAPGFGKSDTPKKVWTFTEYADFINAFLQTLPDKSVILAGHSLGGGFALYTAAHSEKVKKLILIDAMGLPIEHHRLTLYSYYSFQIILDLLTHFNLVFNFKLIKNFLLNLSHIGYLIPFTYKIFDKQLAVDTSVLKKVTIPTQILWGTRDSIFGKKTGMNLQRHLPHASLKFVEGSHNWIIFEPEHGKTLISG